VGGGRDGGPPVPPVDISRIPDATPKFEPRTRAGNAPEYVVDGVRYVTLGSSTGYRERGTASWYGSKFHGRPTANGERYDMYAMTAAHPALPIPSYVEVTNLLNGRQVVVRVNDRGPFKASRLIDLSYVAAAKLDMLRSGTAPVEVRAVGPGDTLPGPSYAKPATVWVQAGAFAEQGNAERLRRRLVTAAVGEVRIEPAAVGGRTLYRVRLGPVASTEQADRLAQALAGLGLPEPLFIVE
ncbi:MAG TPA: septal ring lytic transglycosylase RlpA family protein, partial [Gammaproteobacteria bacterium]